MKKIIIGARGSKLSLAYVNKVKNLILSSSKELNIDIKTIKTAGDVQENVKISEIGGKNMFCKEIEENLIEKKIDIAIHSLKDMETSEHENLIVGAFIKRNDPRDVLVSDKLSKLDDLKNMVIIGSSSKRRELQLKKINNNISVVNIRGNIDTRIKKLDEKKLDGIILAAAGVKSLNLENKISLIFETTEILPAAGQGIIAVQCRKNDEFIINLIKDINDKDTNLCALAERKMLQVIGGDCDTAIGGIAEIKDDNIILKAQLFSDTGDESFYTEFTGKKVDALQIGNVVGKKLLDLAGEKFKKK